MQDHILKTKADKMELTDKEKINFQSYSHPKALAYYDSDKLYEIEKIVIKQFLTKSGARVLDVGCGCGRTTINLKSIGFEVIGIDIVPAMIELAKKRYPGVDFQLMDVCQLDFPDQFFDYVLFSYNGLDYIYPKSKRITALKEIYRVLKNNGLFAFSAHNSWRLPSTIGSLIFTLKNTFNLMIFTHYRLAKDAFGPLYTHYQSPPAQIKELKRIGFSNIKILSDSSSRRWQIYLRDKYPYYISYK